MKYRERRDERRDAGPRAVALIAALLGGAAPSGCYYLYDTDELAPYVPPERPIPPADVNAISISALSAAPALEEGYGDGGGRPALLVVEGADFSDDTEVELVGLDGAGKDVPVPGLTLGTAVIGKRHDFIALPVSVAASAELVGEIDVPLLVRVSKRNGAGERIAATAPWLLKGRFELERTGELAGEGVAKPHVYSKVDVAGALVVRGADALVVRSNSSFRVTGAFNLSANKQTAGVAGGAMGGAPAVAGGGPSGGRGGTAGVSVDGGGGGYATVGNGGATAALAVGDSQISSFATNQSSGGGGGGVLNLLGGAGGGGGGALELSARGALAVGDISSNGGDGSALLNLGDGGGGTGGTIVLRGGGEVTAGNLLARGGAGGDAANAGSPGRIRIDAPALSGGTSTPLAVRGAMFAPTTPLIVTDETLAVTIISAPGARFDLHAMDAAGNSAPGGPALVDFQGAPEVSVRVELRRGYNRLCTTPHGSTVARSESTNCLEVAFVEVPKAP